MSTNFTIKQLLEAGVHYGHVKRKWDPKMAPYIFGVRGGIHIIDLEQTVTMLAAALNVIRETAANNGRILFVGTKFHASEKIKESAKKCGQYYVNHRWLGGMLTNLKTVSQSIKRMKALEEQIANPIGLTKKETLHLQREYSKLELSLGGIREMNGLPDLIIVIDTIQEAIAIKEAKKLEIPTVAIVDSNSCPDDVTYLIPGNDDAIKAINIYCDLFTSAVIEGLQKGLERKGGDLGASVMPSESSITAPEVPEVKEMSTENGG
ncbi:MAG: 30S ribosomal protein S2 [Holosporales bacterium]|jgi:small subunit ribosomal protein S2|nr:30S ribosomal protein S2 [Holosporales bacterium]